MRSWPILMVCALTAISIISCTHSPPEPAEVQPFHQACDKPNEGRRIAVEGYLRLPDALNGTNSVELHLYPDRTFSGKPVGVPVEFGNGPNQAQRITSSYHDIDLKVHLASGALVPFGTEVRVSGRVYFPVVPKEFLCELDNPHIAAVP